MEGGALLGYGTFGCVFDPPLHVISREDGKCTKLALSGRAVGKISESEEVRNEIEASKILSQIPEHSLYFTMVDLKNIHRPCEEDQQTDAGVKACPIVKRSKMSHMLHFTMPHSGVGLSKYFTIHVKEKTILPIEKVLTHLLEAAALLLLNKYVHYDIHSENILFDDVTKMPRIIDFGFSFFVNDINAETLSTRWKVYSPDYPSEAPELTAVQGVRHRLSLDTVVRDIISEKAPLKNAQFILGLPMAKQEQSFRQFWNNSKSIQEQDWPTFFQYYWPGFDAWSIGVVILKMYVYMGQVPKYTQDPSWRGLSAKIKGILRNLLRMNPIERIDCVEALYMFHPESRILESATAKTWLQEKEKLRRPGTV
jgi:serine/threonine protein kinase